MKKLIEIKYFKETNFIRVGYTHDGYPCYLLLDYEKFKHYSLYELEYYINKECF